MSRRINEFENQIKNRWFPNSFQKFDENAAFFSFSFAKNKL